MFCIVFGILAGRHDNGLLMAALLVAGAAVPALVLPLHPRPRNAPGKEPLLSTGLFQNRTSQPRARHAEHPVADAAWATSFVVSVYLQIVRGYNAIQTGVIFTAATVGILASSLAAERLAKRLPQQTLIVAGFVVTARRDRCSCSAWSRPRRRIWAFVPGLLLIGLGLGVMLTPSVNVVQSSFPEEQQGEISGLSRSVSNLGSSFGTAIAGTILVSDLATGNTTYVLAMVVLAVIGLIGLAAATRLPTQTGHDHSPAEAAGIGGQLPRSSSAS